MFVRHLFCSTVFFFVSFVILPPPAGFAVGGPNENGRKANAPKSKVCAVGWPLFACFALFSFVIMIANDEGLEGGFESPNVQLESLCAVERDRRVVCLGVTFLVGLRSGFDPPYLDWLMTFNLKVFESSGPGFKLDLGLKPRSGSSCHAAKDHQSLAFGGCALARQATARALRRLVFGGYAFPPVSLGGRPGTARASR